MRPQIRPNSLLIPSLHYLLFVREEACDKYALILNIDATDNSHGFIGSGIGSSRTMMILVGVMLSWELMVASSIYWLPY